ncbi:hypothetical protein BC938DRAFT_481439 [Jimgerdemannia flammicorona]|uniref:Uncharacterized protein n=1 Tax=Jimgerdemannia flammicorona TaxID=994334 RepID=A0A433QG41_9FUNG|nr:hypothetical protein BC938DRAFT_481439 [Jimgerdemannia flammicorona]
MTTHSILNRSSSITVIQRDSSKQNSVKIEVVFSDPVLSVIEEVREKLARSTYTVFKCLQTLQYHRILEIRIVCSRHDNMNGLSLCSWNLVSHFSYTFSLITTDTVPICIHGYMIHIRSAIIRLRSCENKLLLTNNGQFSALPIILKDGIAYSKFEEGGDDFTWAMKTSMDWEYRWQRVQHHQQIKKSNMNHLEDDLVSIHSSSDDGSSVNSIPLGTPGGKEEEAKSFREAFQAAVAMMKKELNVEQLGIIYDNVVEIKALNVKFIVTISYAPMASMSSIAKDYVSKGTLRWQTSDKLNSMYDSKTEDVWFHASTIYNEKRTIHTGGLYLAVFHADCTSAGMNVLVSKHRKNCLPMYKIRHNPTLTEAEWSWVQGLTHDIPPDVIEEEVSEQYQQFKASFNVAISRLSEQTRLTLDAKDVFPEDTVLITKGLDGSTTALFSNDADQPEALGDTDPEKSPSAPASPTSATATELVTQPQDTKKPQTPIRIIFLVKPMRQATQNRNNIAYNYHDFTFYPFHVFDILHHSVYNSSIYAPLRKMMLNLQDTYREIRKQNSDTMDNLNFPDENLDLKPPTPSASTSTLSRRPSISAAEPALPSSSGDNALTILSDEMSSLTSQWSQLSWSFRLIEFDRKRILSRSGMRAPLTSSASSIKLNPDDCIIFPTGRRKSRVGSLREIVKESGNRALQNAKLARLQSTSIANLKPAMSSSRSIFLNAQASKSTVMVDSLIASLSDTESHCST